jgi:polyhydroxyalkanoate synthase
MGEPSGHDVKLPDPVEISRMMGKIAEQSQRLVAEFLAKQGNGAAKDGLGMSDPLNIGQAFFDMTARMMANPAQLVEAQISLWRDYMTLWQTAAKRMLGEPT